MRRSNREKVIGKRKGKNRARKERKFFSLERSRGFCGRGGTVERVTDFFQKKIGTSVTRLDDVLANSKIVIISRKSMNSM